VEQEVRSVIGSQGIVVEIKSGEARGLLFSSFLGRTRVEETASSASIDGLLSAFPLNAPITLLLPGHLFMTRRVALPFRSAGIIRKTLPFAMEGLVPFPIEEILVDSVPSAPTGTGNSVMALAVPREAIADLLKLFPEGRVPQRVIPDFLSLLSFGVSLKQEQGIYGVLDIERDSTSMVFISGGRPVAMRSIKTDGHGASNAEQVEATMQPLKEEGTAVATLYVTGGAAQPAVPHLERIARVVALPATVRGVTAEEWPAWSALAGGAVSASEFPQFNILGGQSEHGRWAGAARRLSIGAGILLLLGTADLYVRYATASRALSTFKGESRGVFVAVMPHVTRVVKEDAQLKVALSRERETREALIGKTSPSYLAVVKGLDRMVRDHPKVKVREATVTGDRLTIVGDGTGLEAEGLKKLLTGIDGARDAQVEEIAQGVGPNNYRFRMTVRVK
jgi:type II secretory pathway component PulL